MWMLNPKMLCNKHLLGEHGEIHKHRHNFVKKHNMTGRMEPVVQIEPKSMGSRHDELAQEMLDRNMNHQSPFEQPNISYLPERFQLMEVDLSVSIEDLKNRCPDCAERIAKNAA